MTELQTIGVVAEDLGVTTRTLRYYEQVGLIQPTQRAGRSPRLYDAEARARISMVRRMQALGLSLETIRLFLDQRSEVDRLGEQPLSLQRLESMVENVRARHAGMRARVGELLEQLAQARTLERQLARDVEICETRLAQRRAEGQG